MHSYLRAIGFSEYTSKANVQKLLNYSSKAPDSQHELVGYGDDRVAEIKKDFGEGFGLIFNGTCIDDEYIDIDYYYPYVYSKVRPVNARINVEKRVFNNSFSAVFEDTRIGVSVIFYLQNAIDYMDIMANNDEDSAALFNIYLSALSTSGTILLPINMTEKDYRRRALENSNRTRLIEKARMGDESAIERLTLEDMDTYSKLSSRVRTEDIFTIVDSCFMPYGLECDLYTIIADILNVRECVNSKTKENIYILTLNYNGVIIETAINKKDLTGEPLAGRRFKGTIWLQGRVEKCSTF